MLLLLREPDHILEIISLGRVWHHWAAHWLAETQLRLVLLQGLADLAVRRLKVDHVSWSKVHVLHLIVLLLLLMLLV